MAQFTDLQLLLKIANSPILSQFLHDCVDDFVKIKKTNFDNYNNDIEWTIDDFNKAKIAVQNFFKQCIITNSYNLINENLGEQLQEELRNCFEIRQSDIYEILVKENLINNGNQLVENFDWRLKWILGSSKLASIREPLLQVDLDCLQRGGDGEIERNLVNFEMNTEQLQNIIQQLEKAEYELNSKQEPS